MKDQDNIPAREFKKELADLFKKHNVTVKEHEQYDEEDRFIGVDLYPVINGEPDYSKTFQEIFEEILHGAK
jgi:hypothetical protein